MLILVWIDNYYILLSVYAGFKERAFNPLFFLFFYVFNNFPKLYWHEV